MILKLLTGAWLLIMTLLSHTSGTRSSMESQALARWTGVKENSLRQGAHITLFFVLSLLATVSFPAIPLWLRGLVLAGWCIIDEATKPLIPGRHFSPPGASGEESVTRRSRGGLQRVLSTILSYIPLPWSDLW